MQVDVHQESVLLLLLFAVEVDVIMENAGDDLIIKVLFINDLVVMSKHTMYLREKFLKCKAAFENKELKINLRIPK